MSEKKHLHHRPVVLIILDGWGVAIPSQGNAISESSTPHFHAYCSRYPVTTIQASGEATGLPWSEAGNSEVGHMSIGAGRIIYQELSRINASIQSKTFFSNPVFLKALEHVRDTKGTIHLVGIASAGGVHGHIEHLYALLELLKEHGIKNSVIHAILDGRDASYASGRATVEELQIHAQQADAVIGSLSGRFYAMDRDNHWDRVEKAYRAMCEGVSTSQWTNPLEAIDASYARGVYDEEFEPTVIQNNAGVQTVCKDGDAILFLNFRADRARQIVQSFCSPEFSHFKRKKIENLFCVTMTSYDDTLPVSVAYPPLSVTNSLAEVLSTAGLKQLHIAETEKYAHITYFLNDGRETPFPQEKRIMIPSPSVDSYDKKPQMSAYEITAEVTKALANDEFDFIALNFANADMVGHSGNIKATIQAIQVLDQCFSKIIPPVLQKGGALIITADHGNAERLIDLKTGMIDKEHTNNPVPCLILAQELEGRALSLCDVQDGDLSVIEPSGLLSDVAPTILALFGIPQPPDMTGRNILETLI